METGFSVSAKNVNKAVDRNRLKILMREAYSLQKSMLTASLKKHVKFMYVFFIYTGNEIPGHKEVTEKMQSALIRLNKIADEAIAANT